MNALPDRMVEGSNAAREPAQSDTARMVVYLGALLVAMMLIVLYLLGLAWFQGDAYWLNVAAPFAAEILVVFATRALLPRGRVVGATLTFVWGSLLAIVPFVMLFPAAYSASIVAVAQVEAVALWYLRGKVLAATLVGMTLAAGAVAAIGAAAQSRGAVETVSIALIVLLAFALLSVVLGQNQIRLTRALSEAEHARDTLELRVKERTADLEQTARELEAARVAAEAATRTKSAFLAQMSHELRTPLNAIIGFSEILLDSSLSEGTEEERTAFLNNIHRSGKHLLGLINDILDISKVEAGEMELDLEPIHLGEMVAGCVVIIRAVATRKRIEVEWSCDPTDILVTADSAKLRQILYNLLSNAVKFTPEEGRVSVTASVIAAEARVAVRDTGIGIKPEDQQLIFEEFRQADNALSRQEQGTGLGLALVRRLVELHGGSISLESAPGKGSCFTFTLPRAPSEADTQPTQGSALPDRVVSLEADAPGGPTVVVIEDEHEAADLLTLHLRRAGYEVYRASPDNALGLVRQLRPFAVTLDVLMPGQDGWEILRALKSDPSTREIPVVVVSVVDSPKVGLSLGAADYLVKPVDHEALRAAFDRLRAAAQGAGLGASAGEARNG